MLLAIELLSYKLLVPQATADSPQTVFHVLLADAKVDSTDSYWLMGH